MGMPASKIALIAIVVVVLGMVLLVIVTYNNFIGLDQNVQSKWSEVENQYQRQADLIPNLVSVISSSVSVETDFVKDVIAARTNWAGAQTEYDKDKAGVEMNNGITAFVRAVAENYPVLKANAQYVALTDELSGSQNRITVARGRYIESIQHYNTAIKTFPGNVLAGMFGFSEKEYYNAQLNAMNTPSLGGGGLPA
jgi:LemA protein